MTLVTQLDLDVPALLVPLDGSAPAGKDPREDASAQSLYYRLRDARAEARDGERRADGERGEAETPPQWRTVRDLSVQLLRERAKDLEVGAWLTEALVRLHGFAGLTAGANLVRGLAADFWDTGLFPLPDEDGLATVVAPVAGLNGLSGDGTLAQPLRKQAMFTKSDGVTVTFWEYLQAEEVEGIGDAARKKARLASGIPVFAAIESDAKAAGGAYFGPLRDNVTAALLAWNLMSAVLDQKAGSAGPPTSRVRDLLAQILACIQRYAPAVVISAASTVEVVPGATDEPGMADTRATEAPRPVNRDEMLARLSEVADFFREYEPQSPLSLTLDDAIRRARLSWDELLAEVVADQAARDNISIRLGIRPKKPD